MTESFPEPDEMDKGVQPLDKLMTELGLTDANLVDKSTNALTFRMVAKGRKGRRIKLRTQCKILRALNALCAKLIQGLISNGYTYFFDTSVAIQTTGSGWIQ